MDNVKKTERGWAGHYIFSTRCRFRRNTLLEFKKIKIIVSTVGEQESVDRKRIEGLCSDHFYETTVYYAIKNNMGYIDSDEDRQIFLKGKFRIYFSNSYNLADKMHEKFVNQIEAKILKGEIK